MQHILILSPVYNDQDCFNIFAASIEKEIKGLRDFRFSFLVVNDGSEDLELKSELPLTRINLHRNIGHQKAIAIGLAHAHHHLSFDRLIIMDCDGEDKPEDIHALLTHAHSGDRIIVAKRMSRQENRRFRFFYHVYKLMFYLLTGKQISFGNFMSLPKKEVDSIVHYSEIWNHLAGAVIKSNRPFGLIHSHRGKRYTGQSKMNFTALLLHGLGAIGVFIEVIASRLLVFSLFMIALSVLVILAIFCIKFFTDKAIPGWATTIISSMLIVLLQSFLLSLFTIFLYLTSQGQRKFIPFYHYMDYVRSIENQAHGEQL